MFASTRARSTTTRGVSSPDGSAGNVRTVAGSAVDVTAAAPAGRRSASGAIPSRSTREDDLVARLELPAERRVLDLEQAARPDRPRSEEVARPQAHVGGGARDHLAERELRVGPAAARRLRRR